MYFVNKDSIQKYKKNKRKKKKNSRKNKINDIFIIARKHKFKILMKWQERNVIYKCKHDLQGKERGNQSY